MKAKDIKVGGFYRAKVNNRLVTVRVDEITDGTRSTRMGKVQDSKTYKVTNMDTGKRTVFRSAMKFRMEVPDPSKGKAVMPGKSVTLGGVKPAVVDSSTHPVQRVEKPPVTLPPTSKAKSILSTILAKKEAKDALDTAPHLIVKARAGTGKTTTIEHAIRLLRGVGTGLTPTDQQQAIWDAVLQSKDHAKTVGVVAFNKVIAKELKERLGTGTNTALADAMTAHALGIKAIRSRFRLRPGDDGVSEYHVDDIIGQLLDRDPRDLKRQMPVVVSATKKLVELCKLNLVNVEDDGDPDYWYRELTAITSHYDIDLVDEKTGEDFSEAVFELVPEVLKSCMDVERHGRIDFADMVWLPVVLNLPVQRYDLLFVDESQDLSRCLQELVKKAGKRLVFVGDDKQAIYGFAGADDKSLDRLAGDLGMVCTKCKKTREHLGEQGSKFGLNYWSCGCGMGPIEGRGCIELPLTRTRRCGHAIVAEAKRLVPDFEAFEGNNPGEIAHLSFEPKTVNGVKTDYRTELKAGDMVLCRVNAPLVSECFKLIKTGKPANIQGRDIAKGLKDQLKTLSDDSPFMKTVDFIPLLEEWYFKSSNAERAKRNPSDAKLISLADRYECLLAFCEQAENVAGVTQKIDSIFTDDRNPKTMVMFSSIHRAKGLEADTVYLLEPGDAKVPHPMAKTEWAIKQEWNLKYVAITRAIRRLVYVS